MLRTRAETSGYSETSLHADVMAFVTAVAENEPRVSLSTFGHSPQRRAMPLLVLSNRGIRTPEEARRAGLPVVLMLDGIHPGEVEGKEASLALMRDLLRGDHGDLLDDLVLLVMPLFNPDGNDAIDPANRQLNLKKLEGQPGPVVGTRTQSHGINLNRDYLRQGAPEMRLLMQHVVLPWAPDLTIDNHATNGSVHRFQMTIDVPHTVESGRAEPIEFMRKRLVPDVIAAVRRSGFESGWYGNFAEDERALDAGVDVHGTEPVGEGWMTYPHHPRFGSNYRGLTNRLDLLLECYSYLPFAERVHTAYAWQIETLHWAAEHATEIRDLLAASQRPPDRIAVRYRLSPFTEPVEILTRSPRTFEGAPVTLTMPHLAKFVGTKVVDRPRAYVVPPSLAAHLQQHGLAVTPGEGELPVQVATVTSLGSEAGRKILEAGQFGDVTVEWADAARKVPAGWSVVATDQALGAIAVYLCEPESDDGAAENGMIPAPTVGGEHPAWRVRA